MTTDPSEEAMQFRLPILASVMKELNPVYIADPNMPSPLKIKQTFYASTATQSIFQATCISIITCTKWDI